MGRKKGSKNINKKTVKPKFQAEKGKRGRKKKFKPEIRLVKGKAEKMPKLVKGFKDILPDEQKYWSWTVDAIEDEMKRHDFKKIDLPILEETGLFVRSMGKETDVVGKELYNFTDIDNENLCLRPEATAGIVRAYINHGMSSLPQPVRLYTYGPMFRRERPQSGRHRQFYQFNFEILGEKAPIIDAMTIFLTYRFYKKLGLKIVVSVNSIGCPACREEYKNRLVEYYKENRSGLCDDCKRRLNKNPLRLLDCKECAEVKEDAPQIVDFLCEECQSHFFKVLEYLDELEVPYNLTPYLVRGLDYYTKTVFEIMPDVPEEERKSQSALAGGGRYDLLVEQLGGKPTPACGAAIGIDRTILQIKEQKIEPPEPPKVDIFLAQLGDQAKKRSLLLFEQLKDEGINVAESFSKDSLRAQLEIANKLGAKITLIFGQKEFLDETVLLRDMDAHSQEVISQKKIVPEIKKRVAEIEKLLAKRPKTKAEPPIEIIEKKKRRGHKEEGGVQEFNEMEDFGDQKLPTEEAEKPVKEEEGY